MLGDPKKRGGKTMASRVFTRKPQSTRDGKSFSHTHSYFVSRFLALSLSRPFHYSLSRSSISRFLALLLSRSLAPSLSRSRSACRHTQDGIDGGCQLLLREQAMAATRPQLDSTHTLSLSHTHIHTHTMAATRPLWGSIHTHSLSLTHTHTHTHTQTHTCIHTHACTRIFVLLARSLTLSDTHAQPCSPTLSHTHTQTHTSIQDDGCSHSRQLYTFEAIAFLGHTHICKRALHAT